VLLERISQAQRVWLLLDYDGTLVDFERTPDIIRPNPGLIGLLTDLAQAAGVRLAVISGRRLADLRALIPVEGIWLAGTYGAEWLTPKGELVERFDRDQLRPTLELIKAEWQALVSGESGFHLEDKGLALALHAKYAEDRLAENKLAAARQTIERFSGPEPFLYILGGHKFLEVAPLICDKGLAVQYLLKMEPWPGAKLVCLGDDDKDEVAFETVRKLGGICILVARELRRTKARYFLESPTHVREWLANVLSDRSLVETGIPA